MKKIDVGHAIGVLANIGVIAGILFLAVEMHQNNELLAAQGRASRANSREQLFQRLSDPDVRRAILKSRRGEQLSDEERFILDNTFGYMLTGWQHAYLDFREGLIEESDLQIPGLQRVYRSGRYPVLPEYWRSVRDNYRPDFAEWLEENIVDANPD